MRLLSSLLWVLLLWASLVGGASARVVEQDPWVSDLIGGNNVGILSGFVQDSPPSGWASADGLLVGPNLYAYVRQNPWTTWDPLGLRDVRAIIYDGNDPGKGGTATGKDHEKWAKKSGAEITVSAKDLADGVKQLQQKLQDLRQAYDKDVAKAKAMGLDPSTLGTLNQGPPELGKATLLDHGSTGSQTMGVDGAHVDAFSQDFQDLASLVRQGGQIECRGCEAGKGAEGRGYIEDLAVMSNRKVTGYTVDTVSNHSWSPSPETTVTVDPRTVNKSNASSEAMWPKVMQSIRQTQQQKPSYTPVVDPNTNTMPAHISERLHQ